ncbi:ASTRA complex subunit [Pyricularia grisea]|uniref:ASTRA-associated protein 1 n=1 Tax=Pyricularia grisea TaxID=148305 RepID=A0A6P8BAV4_PYRGI|nr:uncharacterized protein PgNI_03594 [Pyricularia grisea]KAI6362022.1 ASTRA complex subunit [Pyricularia grisea]TLD12934.1 hypothetical protein PgNI_03594 [Pyricularia grisea]
MSTSAVPVPAQPAHPRSILRGHKAQVHAVAFVRNNERLVTGDADGFVVVWDLTIMRPRAVWRAHGEVLLGIGGWGSDRLITHGRDNKLIVWQLREADEDSLAKTLPVDPAAEDRPKPWLLYMLEISTMNFCTFSLCEMSSDPLSEEREALIAVPNTLSSEVKREHTIRLGQSEGMVMALELFIMDGYFTVAVGYENGVALVAQQADRSQSPVGTWNVRYRSKAHTQPVLSLDMSPSKDFFLTSSADSLLIKHPIPHPPAASVLGTTQEKSTTSEGANANVVDSQPPALASKPLETPMVPPTTPGKPMSLLSAALAREAAGDSAETPTRQAKQPQNTAPESTPLSEPVKVLNTRHAGQQGLRIRSDGRIFATAGWDSRVRVYSCKTMKELAVLKWHQVGCFAVAFSTIDAATENQPGDAQDSLVSRRGDVTVKEKRILHAKSAHWLAAGSKDGKVSLWEIY